MIVESAFALVASATLSLGAASSPHPSTATLPACSTDVVVWDTSPSAPSCNLTPPQVLVLVLGSPSDADVHLCDDLGGKVLISPLVKEVLCLGVDY